MGVGIARVLVGSVLLFGCTNAGTATEPSTGAAEAAVSAPDVQQILAAMKERYRSAKSYRDTGTLRDVVRRPGDPDIITTARFRTVWQGPGRLGFEFRKHPEEFFPAETIAVWTPRSGGVKVLFLDETRDESSLDEALMAMQGVTHLTTGLVPRWLLDGGCNCRAQYTLRATAACGSSTCFVLDRTLDGSDHIALFVDTKTSALKRFEQRLTITPRKRALSPELLQRLSTEEREHFEKLEPFESESTLEFDPKFDVPVDDNDFEGALTLR